MSDMMIDGQRLPYYLGFMPEKKVKIVIDCQDLPANVTEIKERHYSRTEIVFFAHEARALGWEVDLAAVESELVEAYL